MSRGQNVRASQPSGTRIERVVGRHAVEALLKQNASHVRELAYTSDHFEWVEALLAKVPFKGARYERSDAALTGFVQSEHHEGIYAARVARSAMPWAHALKASSFLYLYLDGVTNPHNVGAIARTAAFFGASGIAGTASALDQQRTTAAYRNAQGGFEYLEPVHFSEREAIKAKEQDFAVVVADAHRGTPVSTFQFPKRAVLCLGSERDGPEQSREWATHWVSIEGIENSIESLNVSVAAGVLLSSWRMQTR